MSVTNSYRKDFYNNFTVKENFKNFIVTDNI